MPAYSMLTLKLWGVHFATDVFGEILMNAPIEDISPAGESRIAIMLYTSRTTGLRFSLNYLLLPEKFQNIVSEIEIAPMLPLENSRVSVATFNPADEVIVSMERVMRYFQHAKKHLLERRGKPLSFAQWAKTH